MNKLNVKGSGHGQIFKNPFLEALTRSNPVVTVLTYGTIIGSLLYINYQYGFVQSWGLGIALYLTGMFVWTFFEYILHRYVFHFISESKFIKRFHYTVHGVHHEYPRDEQHLFMPPLPGIFLGAMFTFFFYLFLGTKAFVFSAGFINGYFFYAAIHYSTHAFKPPKSGWIKRMWRHHSLHHYKYPDLAYGVSSPIWDYVFGTLPPMPKKRDKKQQQAVNA